MIFIIIGSVLGFILLSLLILYLIISLYASHCVLSWAMYPKFDTREARKARNAKDGNSAGTESWERKEFTVTMPDGYIIHGDMTKNDPKKVVLLLHGHGSTREGVVKYARVFYELGYSIVIYDHRGHGDNERTYSTLGFRESKDAFEMFKFVRKEFGEDAEIGVFGVSMGGASTVLMTQYTQDMDFIVLDCPYAGFDTMLKQICKDKHQPSPLPLLCANLNLKKKCHCSFKDVNVREFAKKITVPVLNIHGSADTKLRPHNQKLIMDNVHSYKETMIVEGAEHGQSVNVDPVGYRKKVKEFIENVHKLKNERE